MSHERTLLRHVSTCKQAEHVPAPSLFETPAARTHLPRNGPFCASLESAGNSPKPSTKTRAQNQSTETGGVDRVWYPGSTKVQAAALVEVHGDARWAIEIQELTQILVTPTPPIPAHCSRNRAIPDVCGSNKPSRPPQSFPSATAYSPHSPKSVWRVARSVIRWPTPCTPTICGSQRVPFTPESHW